MTLNTKSLDEMIKEAIARKKREQGYNKGGDTSVPDPDTTERLGPDSEDDEKPPILRRRKRKTMHDSEDSESDSATELEIGYVRKKHEQAYTKDEDTPVPNTTERQGPDSEEEEEPTLRRQKRKTMHQAEDSDTELEVDKVINKRTVTEYLVGYRGSGKEMTAQWVRKSDVPSAKEAINTFNRCLRECAFLGVELPPIDSQEPSKRGPGRPRKSLLRPRAR